MTTVARDDEASVLAVLRYFTAVIEETGPAPKVARLSERQMDSCPVGQE
ncbi:hypothetical protein [Streptomyces zhihengii]